MNRVAGLLILLFPAAFRLRYGSEVVGLLRDRAADVRRREGIPGMVRMWSFEISDLLRAAYAERRFVRRAGGGQDNRVTRRPGGTAGGVEPPRRRSVGGMMDELARDLRHARRTLARAPGFAAVVIITLALGIGATTAIFTVVDGVLLKPLPYPDADDLFAVYHRVPPLGADTVNHTSSTFLTYHAENRSFEQFGAWNPTEVVATGRDEPERVDAVAMTEGVLRALRAQPRLGRGFSEQDTLPGAPMVVILTHGYWARRFGADEGIVGRDIRIEGQAAEVVGVMPPDFVFLGEASSLYVPLHFDRNAMPTVLSFDYRVVARLAPRTTPEAAAADLERLIPMSVERYAWLPAEQVQEWQLGINLRPLKESVVQDSGAVLWILQGTVGLVLLIACANVANLLLVRAEGRRREIALRTAIGASRGRLTRQFLVESSVLTALGALAGLALAYAAVPMMLRLTPAALPRAGEIGVDARVLLFTLLISAVAAVVFSLFPIAYYGASDLVPALKEGGHGAGSGRRRHRVRGALAVAEVALALVLLVGAGLMIRSFQALRDVDPGFSDPGRAMIFRLALPAGDYPDEDRALAAYEAVIARIAEVPGVTHVGAISGLTMEGRSNQNSFMAQDVALGDEGEGVLRGAYKAMAGDYFGAAGIPLIAGRSITWDDIRERRRVGLVTETLAREFWGEPSAALGKQIRHSGDDPWREVIGVVGDVRDGGLRSAPRSVAFWPVIVEDFLGFDVWLRRDMAFVVRTDRANPFDVLPQVRDAVGSVDPNLPLADIGTLDRVVARNMASTSFILAMLLLAAGVAVALGTIGIYGVISYVFSQRTREIGIRVALGATTGDVRGMVLRQGALIGVLGVGIGVGAAIALARFLTAQVYGVGTMDPATYLGASLAVGGVALLASYVPALRTTAVDPLDALRR